MNRKVKILIAILLLIICSCQRYTTTIRVTYINGDTENLILSGYWDEAQLDDGCWHIIDRCGVRKIDFIKRTKLREDE